MPIFQVWSGLPRYFPLGAHSSGASAHVSGQKLLTFRVIYQSPPTITGIYVSGLAHPDFLVEMDAIAVVPL